MSIKFINHKVLLLIAMLFALLFTAQYTKEAQAVPEQEVAGGGGVRYVGPFTNTTLGLGGSVLIDFQAEPTTISGYINFTDGPNVAGVLCGAGNFSGTRTGNNFQATFISNDPEPGCGVTHGLTYNISGVISGGEIVNGAFSVPSMGQNGIFSAKQTIRSTGTFFNDDLSLSGDVYVDLAAKSNSIAGYINFTGAPNLCGANSFTGSRSGNNLAFSFRSSDPDPGCEIIDEELFNLNAILSHNSLQNGTYHLPTFGQGGTFSTTGPGNDTTAPNGNITSPTAGANIGVGAHTISANAADNSGGTGVGYVDFWVKYNGAWHFISTDPTPPYSARWQTPPGLHTQIVRFAINITDKSGNTRTTAGGDRWVSFNENNPGVTEVIIPQRYYLNQLSLTPDGNIKCGAASMAMVLAMNGIINGDYNTMAAKADEMFPRTISGGYSWVHLMVAELNRQGAIANAHSPYLPKNDVWGLIKQEVNAGRPIIFLTGPNVLTQVGHFIVVVGYRETNSTRHVVAYDPFGKWLGGCCNQNYDMNSTSPNSHKGKGPYYSFDAIYGQYSIITARSPNNLVETFSGNFIPDEVSDEPENIVTYEGIPVETVRKIYLPLVIKP